MWGELPTDVFIELIDPKFETMTHHSRGAYNKGCRGPLCRKEQREEKERKRIAQAELEGRELRPYVQTQRSYGDIHRNEVLDRIHAWHLSFRSQPKELQTSERHAAAEQWLRDNSRKGAEVA